MAKAEARYITVPLGSLDTSGPRYDDLRYLRVENLVPLRGTFLPIRKAPDISADSAWGTAEVTGAHAHIVTEERSESRLYPDEDVERGNWTRTNGLATGLNAHINETDPSTDEYIASGGSPTNDVAIFGLGNHPEGTSGPATSTDDIILFVQYEVEGVGGGTPSWTLDVDLVEDPSGTPNEIRASAGTATINETGSADQAWSTVSATIASAVYAGTDPITDWNDLGIQIDATVTGDGAENLTPDEDIRKGGWDPEGTSAESTIYESIDDDPASLDDSTTYVRSPKLSQGDSAYFDVGLPALTGDLRGTWTLNVRSRLSPSTSPTDLKISLRSASDIDTEIASNTVLASSNSTSWATFSYTLTSDEVSALEEDMVLRVTATQGTNPGSNDRVWVSAAWVAGPDPAKIKVAWAAVQVPTDQDTLISDQVEVYAGDDNKLWLNTNDDGVGWQDVSRVTDYVQGDDEAVSWEFCSFGNTVVATNFWDEVQGMNTSLTETAFSDLISTTEKPRARHCATIGGYLVLADIGASGVTNAGAPDMVWNSGFDAPDEFYDVSESGQEEDAFRTGSDRQRLTLTPGRITGLVGGEYGIVFKATSVLRIDKQALDSPWFVSVLANGIGTLYPKSIVPVGRDVYFYDGGSFAVVRGGQSVERIGSEAHHFYLNDWPNAGAIKQTALSDPRTKEGNMVGAYDKFTGCIWWFYRREDDALYSFEKALIYNVFEGTWSTWGPDDTDRGSVVINYPLSYPRTDWSKIDHRGIKLVTRHTTNKAISGFEDEGVYDYKWTTNYFSSQSITGVANQTIRITGLRLLGRRRDAQKRLVHDDSDIQVTSSRDQWFSNDDPDGLTVTKAMFSQQGRTGWMSFDEMGQWFQLALRLINVSDLGDSPVIPSAIQVRYVIEAEEAQ